MRVRSLPLAVAAVVVLAGSAVAGEKPVAELKLGLLQGMFRDVPPAMVGALAKPFRDLMFKSTGYAGNVELFDDPLELAAKMKDQKVDIGVFHGFEFAWAQQSTDGLVPLIVTMPPGGKVQAMVVVHKDSAAKTLDDLKGEPVSIPRGARSHSIAFLGKLRHGFGKNDAKPNTRTTETPEDVLNDVANGKSAMALVDAAALDGYKTLQPGLCKNLRILQESEQFPQTVIAYRKGAFTEDEAARIRTGLTGAAKTASGKVLMSLWNLRGFEAVPTTYQGSLDKILKAYPLPTDEAVKTAGTSSGGK